jgi:hypothetical protein
MFIRKSAFENLVKRCESQQQQIENLNEMLGILAQSLGQQFEFNVGRGWNLSSIRPGYEQFIETRRQEGLSSDWSF